MSARALVAADGCGTACGTFGELLQGALIDADSDFLVTLPIARSSTAHFELAPDRNTVSVHPAGKCKSRQLAELMLRRHGLGCGGTLTLTTELPEGKGHASSSADLVATARAVGGAIGVNPDPAEIETLMATIEPSDGVMYAGVVAFHHRRVRLLAHLGHLPPITIVGIDEGGQLDTVAFNRQPKRFSMAERREYDHLLAVVSAAVRSGDLGAIGRVATRSAVLNQRLRPKAKLTDMITLAETTGALGVVTAHSGTILGLMFADNDHEYDEKVAAARHACRVLAGDSWIDRTQVAS
ncbi:kinase [Micromonospora echinofusca]|uniref:Kinase n=2 Tax=Micromonospora echinofusca TaxID=47858 RepID=A0ABS3VJ35_MICEH|nr:kinase [Micromonospora echinofusca]